MLVFIDVLFPLKGKQPHVWVVLTADAFIYTTLRSKSLETQQDVHVCACRTS